MRRALSLSLASLASLAALASLPALTGCPESAPPVVPAPGTAAPDTSWIQSEKLDADLQELVLRAYEVDLVFPLLVRTQDEEGTISETVEHVRPSEIGALVYDERVVAVRCAPPPTEAAAADDGWRAKVDDDVRAVYGANSSCWIALTLTFGREPTDDEWAAVDAAGVVVHARDARTALVWVPVRAIPRIAALPFVESLETFASPAD